jgi:predicted phosphoribosyltransferase
METRRFRDRTEAGRLLAQRLRSYAGRVRELLERAEGAGMSLCPARQVRIE